MIGIFSKEIQKERQIKIFEFVDSVRASVSEEIDVKKGNLTVIRSGKLNSIVTSAWNKGLAESERFMESCAITGCVAKASTLTVEGYPLCDKHYETYRFSWKIKCPNFNGKHLKVELKDIKLIEKCSNCDWKSGGS